MVASAHIKCEFLNLYDKWPGPIQQNLGIPTDGFDGTTSNDVSNPVYPAGTKVMVYNDSSYAKGWSTMMYAAFADGTNSAVGVQKDMSDGYRICWHSESTAAIADYTRPPWWVLTCCGSTSDATLGGPGAIACYSFATSTAYYPKYGWFWVGGVAPTEYVPRFKTTAAAAATNGLNCASSSNAGLYCPVFGAQFIFGAGTSNCGAVIPICNTIAGAGDNTLVGGNTYMNAWQPNGIIFCGTAVD